MKLIIDLYDEVYNNMVVKNEYTHEDIIAVHNALIGATRIPERHEKGVWYNKKITIKKAHGIAYGRWGCSVCKVKQPHKSNFCPNCGADMREDGEQG